MVKVGADLDEKMTKLTDKEKGVRPVEACGDLTHSNVGHSTTHLTSLATMRYLC